MILRWFGLRVKPHRCQNGLAVPMACLRAGLGRFRLSLSTRVGIVPVGKPLTSMPATWAPPGRHQHRYRAPSSRCQPGRESSNRSLQRDDDSRLDVSFGMPRAVAPGLIVHHRRTLETVQPRAKSIRLGAGCRRESRSPDSPDGDGRVRVEEIHRWYSSRNLESLPDRIPVPIGSRDSVRADRSGAHASEPRLNIGATQFVGSTTEHEPNNIDRVDRCHGTRLRSPGRTVSAEHPWTSAPLFGGDCERSRCCSLVTGSPGGVLDAGDVGDPLLSCARGEVPVVRAHAGVTVDEFR